MNSKPFIMNCGYDSDTDVPTAAIKPKQLMAAPQSPLYTKSVKKPVLVNHSESSVSEVNERDIETVNPVMLTLIFSITHANENLIYIEAGHNVNSNDPFDRVDNFCATDIHSDTKGMFVLRIGDGLEMKIKCLLYCCNESGVGQ